MKSKYSHMYYVKLAPGILRRLRKQKGLTQKELGQKVGVAVGTICNWERSLCTCSERYIKALAQALGVHGDYISRWEVGASRPNAASMQKLCNFFHCSPDDLFITPSKSEEKS